MFTRKFWQATAERACKTAAQAAALVLGADLLNVNAFQADWQSVGGFALGGFALSVLTSLGSAAVTSDPGPSLTHAEVLSRPLT